MTLFHPYPICIVFVDLKGEKDEKKEYVSQIFYMQLKDTSSILFILLVVDECCHFYV